jgi:hypothetical protein
MTASAIVVTINFFIFYYFWLQRYNFIAILRNYFVFFICEFGNPLSIKQNSQHPSPYSPNHAETPINKGIGKIRHSPRYSPCTSPTCSPTRSFTSVKQRISEFLKFDDGEPSSEYPGEVLGEYLSTKIAHKPLTDKYLSFHW